MNKSCFLSIILVFFISSQAFSQSTILKLDDCLNIAIENNLLLKNEKLNLEIAGNNRKQAGYMFLPSVTADAHHQHSSSLSAGINNRYYSGQTSINANLQLFNWFNNWIRLEQARNNLYAYNFAYRNRQLDLKKSIIESFFSLLIAHENVNAYEEIVAAADSLVISTRVLHQAGKIPSYNVDEAMLQLSQDRQFLLNSRKRYRVSWINLMKLMNSNEHVGVDFEYYSQLSKMESYILPSYDKFLGNIISHHPIINQLKAEYDNITLGSKMIASSMKPSVSLRYSIQSHYSGVENTNVGLFDNYGNNFVHLATLNLTIPIFNRMERRTQLWNNELDSKKILNTLKDHKTQIEFMVEELYYSLIHQNEVLKQSKIELEHLRNVYESHYELYLSGKGDLFTVLNYRKQLNQVISSNVRNKYELAIIREILSLYSF